MSAYVKAGIDKDFPVSVLVIDDNDAWRESVVGLCKSISQGLGEEPNVVQAGSAEEGLLALTRQEFQVVLLDKELIDINGNNTDGIELIPEVLRIQPHVQLLMFTGEDDPRQIVKALHLGAAGYLLKKGEEGYEEYRRVQLKLAFTRAKIAIDKERLSRTRDLGPIEFVARSPAMKLLSFQLEALADFPRPVLFTGATGLGKGAAARQLHNLRAKNKKQTNRPFFNLNIANLSGDMALSELFGHEPNSFTGAGSKVKQGYFELANNGDIFLDEIGEASPELQARLLKVIEERQFQRVGGNRTLTTNAGMIFATNRDLKKMVSDGKFREDLYMRISALTVVLPSLEDRKEDIPDLIRVFLSRFNRERSGEPIVFEELPTDLVDHLMRDGVPGNIRGLENDLQRAIVFCPKDNKGRPLLTAWKTALGMGKRYSPSIQQPSTTMTLDQFLSIQTDFLRPGFKGIQQIRELIEDKVLEEAERKFSTNLARAEALQLDPAAASRKFALLKKGKSKALAEKAIEAGIGKDTYGK
jgi:two-component system response regulator HydG